MGNGKKGYDGKTGLKSGIAFEKSTGQGLNQITDVMKVEADCGCGIDCCNKQLVLTDRTTGTFYGVFFDNGGMFFENLTTGDISEVTATPLES